VSAVFVTGTDTGCGKTAVACALARSLRSAGKRVRVLKPIETGCLAVVPADALALA
jgi:dethiobiotin synthetase